MTSGRTLRLALGASVAAGLIALDPAYALSAISFVGGVAVVCVVGVWLTGKAQTRIREHYAPPVDLNAYRARREHPAGKGLRQLGGQR